MPRRRAGEWRCSSTTLNLGIRWRWVANLTPYSLYSSGKNHRYILDEGMGGPQDPFGYCGVEKNLSSLWGVHPRPSSPSLYRLNYPSSRIIKLRGKSWQNSNFVALSLCETSRHSQTLLFEWHTKSSKYTFFDRRTDSVFLRVNEVVTNE